MSIPAIRSTLLILCPLILLAGCATAPQETDASATALSSTALQCPPPNGIPQCADEKLGALLRQPPETGVEAPRGRLEKTGWSALPKWENDDLARALGAFTSGCPVLAEQPAWASICTTATALGARARNAQIARFFRDNFEPYQILNTNETSAGMVTGYYEPLLHGSRTRSARYRFPIYATPQDMLTIDLSSVYPDFKHKRLRGRMDGGKVIPYFSRADIDNGASLLNGLEIAWVDDAVELFFLHIQGSGQIQLENGERLRIGYADQNGHPFRSLGGALIRKGEIRPEQASMQGIKEWTRKNPGKAQEFMNTNPSYVFFKELPGGLSGPIGTLGVPLTAERSLAIDQRVVPLGVPVYLSTTYPGTATPLNRLMVAQDTGGAINGAVRADFYWGFGEEAGKLAGRMKQTGRMWVLLPKGYDSKASLSDSSASTKTAGQ
jgi:membrane-bound lytic murein transglycosylase A